MANRARRMALILGSRLQVISHITLARLMSLNDNTKIIKQNTTVALIKLIDKKIKTNSSISKSSSFYDLNINWQIKTNTNKRNVCTTSSSSMRTRSKNLKLNYFL